MLYKENRPLLFVVIGLAIVSLIAIYSASYSWALLRFHDAFYYVKRQAVFWGIGLFAMWYVSNKQNLFIRKYSKVFLCISYIFMILVLFLGVNRNGSQSWFTLGPISFQPSELLKLSLIIQTSKLLASSHFIRRLRDCFLPIFLTIVGFVLIMLQPDFGSGIVMLMSIACMIFVSGLPLRYFFVGGIFALIGGMILIVMAPYRFARILAFIDPFADPLGYGFQNIQSMYALSGGGILGRGLFHSVQKQFFLPEPHTDFIFAIIVEEMGLGGGMLVLALYAIVIHTCMNKLQYIQNEEDYYMNVGILSLLFVQIAINVCVVVGLFPITGITLPFISYGGSSLFILLIGMGIVMNNQHACFVRNERY